MKPPSTGERGGARFGFIEREEKKVESLLKWLSGAGRCSTAKKGKTVLGETQRGDRDRRNWALHTAFATPLGTVGSRSDGKRAEELLPPGPNKPNSRGER